MSESPVIYKLEFNVDLWESNLRLLMKEAGHDQEQIEARINERRRSMSDQNEKTYPASIVQKAVQYSREGRDSHTELERIMDLLMGLQPWQVLVHGNEISNIHLDRQAKIVNSKSGMLTDYSDRGDRPDQTILLVIDGKLVPVRRWDDIIVYMDEE